MITEYIQELPGTEVRSIGGRYIILKEGRMHHRGRILLFWVGVAVVDSSCCGTGGCRFIHVPGYATGWHSRIQSDGLPVSTVEPVVNERDRKRIKTLLDRQFPHSQISFKDA